MAVLGSLLVLSGGAVRVLRAMRPEPEAAATTTTTETAPTSTTRFVQAVLRIPDAYQLIGWGVVLLVLGAVAAGAISFNLGAEAGTR